MKILGLEGLGGSSCDQQEDEGQRLPGEQHTGSLGLHPLCAQETGMVTDIVICDWWKGLQLNCQTTVFRFWKD